MTRRLKAGNSGDLKLAADILRGGGTVAFPTETVYGLGANALDPVAVAKIFEAKQRPGWDPLIVHVSDAEMLSLVVREVIPQAQGLMDAFWPGPLTLLLPKTDAVPEAVTAARSLVGVRMPKHPVALELIRLAGVPIAAPSANRFGHTSPTTAQHVLDDLDGRIDAVLDGGATEIGVESTVVGPDPEDPSSWLIYRPGGATREMLDAAFPVVVLAYFAPKNSVGELRTLPSPGVGIRHYAPKALLVLVEEDLKAYRLEDSLVEAVDVAFDGRAQVGVMLPDGWDSSRAQLMYRWGPWWDRDRLARGLFAGLRALDELGATVIVCPVPAGEGISAAIRDRLEKAARLT